MTDLQLLNNSSVHLDHIDAVPMHTGLYRQFGRRSCTCSTGNRRIHMHSSGRDGVGPSAQIRMFVQAPLM